MRPFDLSSPALMHPVPHVQNGDYLAPAPGESKAAAALRLTRSALIRRCVAGGCRGWTAGQLTGVFWVKVATFAVPDHTCCCRQWFGALGGVCRPWHGDGRGGGVSNQP